MRKIYILVTFIFVTILLSLLTLLPNTPSSKRKLSYRLESPSTKLEVVSVPIKSVTRRLQVTGADGFFVVIEPDGSSYLETPDGRHEKLTDSGKQVKNSDNIILKAAESIIKPEKKIKLTQPIVCDTGVVDVPTTSIVTFIGKEHVVVVNLDGSSTAYYTDGKVEQRDKKNQSKRNP